MMNTRVGITLAACWLLLPGMGRAGMDKKWVQDPQASSQTVLAPSQGSRIVPLSAGKTLELVRSIMREELNMTLAEYQSGKHVQSAKTSIMTLLPEKIEGDQPVLLTDDGYFFLLEAALKEIKGKIKLQLSATPVYAVESAQKADKQKPAIEIKVQGEPGDMVRMGQIVVLPTGYTAVEAAGHTLPDASDRAAKLVRAFMYYLDQKLAGNSREKLNNGGIQ